MKPSAEEIFKNCFLPDNKPIDLPGTAGLILFEDHQNSPIAILATANIRQTVKNKLSAPIEKTKRADLKSITAKIYYTTCPCKFRLAIKNLDAVKRIFGPNYKDHITLVSPRYLAVDLNKKIPFFYITKSPTFQKDEKILGPFATQRSAAAFLNTLQDAFGLCRRSDLLRQAQDRLVNNPQKAKSCPYLQMDACAGVCGGKISPDEYKKIVAAAFSAGANPANAIETFQTEMQILSKELNFEKASALKKKIEKLSALNKPSYKWTSDLKVLKIVHIAKSAKIKPEGSKTKKQSHAIFVMNFFQIIDLGDFIIEAPDVIYDVINKNMENLSYTPDNDALERFSVVSYFLYRSKPLGLWLNVSKGFQSKDLLNKQII